MFAARIYSFILIFMAMMPITTNADTIDKLKTFIASTRSGQADFEQQMLDKHGKILQTASGIMLFVRPGKFRWEYRKPYEQLIVGDGSKFWLYDVDLNQVTVKKLDAALGNSPAALLSGSNEIERNFILQDSGELGGLSWLLATPKSKDTSFESIRMGFNDDSELVIMELKDAFEHITVMHFSKMQRNPKLDAKLFKFIPPAGADVLGE